MLTFHNNLLSRVTQNLFDCNRLLNHTGRAAGNMAGTDITKFDDDFFEVRLKDI